MKIDRAKYLADAFINNRLTRQEFDDFLDGLHDHEMLTVYSEILESHFHRLLPDKEDEERSDTE